MNTTDIIDSNYTKLTKTEKKIANFILQDQRHTLINMTLLELSKQLRLGEASIIRFCRKMGFRGFQDLKLSMAIESAQDEEKDKTGRAGEADNSIGSEKMIRVIQNTDACVNREHLKQAVALMGVNEQVYFYGAGSSGIAAEIAETRFIRMGRRSKSVRDSHIQTIQAAIMSPEDVVVAISVSGTTHDLYNALMLARDSGSKIIAITNHENSPIAEIADCVLLTSAPENPITGGTFESIVSQLYVLDMLFSCYSANNRETVSSYREKVAISINRKLETK
ncbi:MurR/RpiR family transcriptional regulator [Lachnospiraceae bacterium JLR.KK008]